MTAMAGNADHNRSGRSWLRKAEQTQSADADAGAHDRLWEKTCDQHREKAQASSLAAETTKQGAGPRHSDDEDLRALLKQVVRQVNDLARENQKQEHRAQEYAIDMDYRFNQVLEGQMRLEKRMQRLQLMVAGESRGVGSADGYVRRGSSADNCCFLSGSF